MANQIGVPRDGLIAEYLFHGDARDTSGSGRHGVVHGVTLATDRFGKDRSAFQFDGIDDFIEVSPPPTYPNKTLSVSVWARFAARDMKGWTNCIIAQDDGNDDDQSRRVFQLSCWHGHVVWHRMVGARDPIEKHWVRFNTWYHFAATYANNVHRLYVDGVLCDTIQHDLWTHAEQPLHIGRKGTPEQHFFVLGDIDDIRLYDRALSEEEVVALFREGGFANISVGTFDNASGALTLEGNAKHAESGVVYPYRVVGVLDDQELTVTFVFGTMTDNMIFTKEGV